MIEPGITSLQTKVFAQVICTLGTDSKEKQKIEPWKLGKQWRSLDTLVDLDTLEGTVGLLSTHRSKSKCPSWTPFES